MSAAPVAGIFAAAFWLILAAAAVGTWDVPTGWIVTALIGAPLTTWVGIRSVRRRRERRAASRPTDDALYNADREIEFAKASLDGAKWQMIILERAPEADRPEIRRELLAELDWAASASKAARKHIE